jgi:hypothetical protein
VQPNRVGHPLHDTGCGHAGPDSGVRGRTKIEKPPLFDWRVSCARLSF